MLYLPLPSWCVTCIACILTLNAPRYAWQERVTHVPKARSRRASVGSRRSVRMRQQRFSRSRSSGSESGKRACPRILLLLPLLLSNPSGRKSPQPLECPRHHPTQVKHDTALTKALEAREERKRFYLVVTQLDPHTKIFSFCDDKYFHSS
jgi:hypothetical protein